MGGIMRFHPRLSKDGDKQKLLLLLWLEVSLVKDSFKHGQAYLDIFRHDFSYYWWWIVCCATTSYYDFRKSGMVSDKHHDQCKHMIYICCKNPLFVIFIHEQTKWNFSEKLRHIWFWSDFKQRFFSFAFIGNFELHPVNTLFHTLDLQSHKIH